MSQKAAASFTAPVCLETFARSWHRFLCRRPGRISCRRPIAGSGSPRRPLPQRSREAHWRWEQQPELRPAAALPRPVPRSAAARAGAGS